ncbi:glycogen/starch/alpha-glucan family phosphorylase [Planomicrobium sp. CPCC 101110]|uniref:glycogen/starch/alpha-glucan family phosphorylase n=1 Tax=Planomicrobium sp. CPCC 101110 TaxID=2599619 RepID=UPI0011B6C187|nr:glycogen/starch/alpha-glucan family phosphorylase [Planomicrobium sp. CPCC 101110]TWT24795.1 glycogen/starch/alpha-glucan phosphorylase [Planomicrobium sp. CPCC 101110]
MFDSKEEFKKEFTKRLKQTGEDKDPGLAYAVLGAMVREVVEKDWVRTNKRYEEAGTKQLYYFSIEFLIGRMLGQNLHNLGIFPIVQKGLQELGFSLDELEEMEPEPGLGNGGLGRLAACFLDSLAALQLPGHGYGIRYKGGLFTQRIENGFQSEYPTNWITETGNREIRRDDLSVEIPFYGRLHPNLKDVEWVKAVPYDMPIIGASGGTVNTLRLWQAEISGRPLPETKDFEEYEAETAAISDRLYPNDSLVTGKILRLKQQYFMCSASLQTILRTLPCPIRQLPDHVAIQINDTHPAIAIPELMRLLLDVEGLEWEEAWNLTTRTISYTNHTILGEAMEKWDSSLLASLVPRVYEIIQEIDRRFKAQLQEQQCKEEAFKKMSIIDGGIVKMAVLAVVGSYKVNGVAQLHTDILKNRELKELHRQFPEKFHNKTNGITHRRWLIKANPELTKLITDSIGEEWIKKPILLNNLEKFAIDSSFLEALKAVKQTKKNQLIDHVGKSRDSLIDPLSIFDIHIKRFHGYKRQLMNILHIQSLYDRIKEDSTFRPYPRTFFFGGKAAPGYEFAKQVIKLINVVADKVNKDPLVRKHIHVVFVEDYNVSHGEKMFPAADVSEQISTASKEASGTGNMKFMMNGGITLGTLDGANVEIVDHVGKENAFIFGLHSQQIMMLEKHKTYRAQEVIEESPELKRLIARLLQGELSDGIGNISFIRKQLVDLNDPYFVLKDFHSYAGVHEKMVEAYADQKEWWGMSVKNIAESGIFSSDRTIQQYSDEVWRLEKILVRIES